MVNGILVILSLVAMSLFYFRVGNQLLQCYAERDHDEKLEINHNLKRADFEAQCWIDHPVYGLALLELIVFICVTSVPILNAMLTDYTSFTIIMNPVNSFVYILAFPTFVAFFSAYSISRYADLTWGQRPTVLQQGTAPPDNMPKCSRCNHPCAQGDPDHCEEHAWLQGKVNLCRWAAYFLVIVNVTATAAFLYVSPVIPIAIIYINGSILAILALTRTLVKLAMRLWRAACCFATRKYVKLPQKDSPLGTKTVRK